jgi:ketosteroid isomerase-like protein
MDARPLDADLEEVIAASRVAFVDALNAGRPEDAAALYAVDARLLAPSAQVIDGRAAIESFWRAGVQAGVADVELEPLELDHRGGAVYEIGHYTLRLTPDGETPRSEGGKYLLVHQRQPDGSWQWAVEMFNPDGPPTGIPNGESGAARSAAPAIRPGEETT